VNWATEGSVCPQGSPSKPAKRKCKAEGEQKAKRKRENEIPQTTKTGNPKARKTTKKTPQKKNLSAGVGKARKPKRNHGAGGWGASP